MSKLNLFTSAKLIAYFIALCGCTFKKNLNIVELSKSSSHFNIFFNIKVLKLFIGIQTLVKYSNVNSCNKLFSWDYFHSFALVFLRKIKHFLMRPLCPFEGFCSPSGGTPPGGELPVETVR